MRRGLVFNIQKYSVQDGPGIRTTAFLKGCPLRCEWCHNPEGISSRREILVQESRCIRCGECRRACSHSETNGNDARLPTNLATCELCGACIEACPSGARQMVGRELTVKEVMTAVLQDRLFYEDSGGGVTFSGGEPLSQAPFLREALQACRREGIHTAVDTCGYAPPADLLAVAALTDLFLYDLKFINDAAHRKYTGVSNRLVLENLQALGRAHKSIWVRVPVIPGLNDSKVELSAIARFAASVPGVQQTNLLPFHRSGISKAQRLGRTAPRAQQTPSAETMACALDIFRGAGLSTCAGGQEEFSTHE